MAGPRLGSGSGRRAGLGRPLPGRAAVTQPPPHHTHPSPGFPQRLRRLARPAAAAGRPGRPRGFCGDSVGPDGGGWGGEPGAALPPREPCRRGGGTRTLGWRRWRRRARGREWGTPRRPVWGSEARGPPSPASPEPPRRESRVGAAGKGRARGGGREEGTCHTPLFSSESGSGGGRPSKCLHNKKFQGLAQRAQK